MCVIRREKPSLNQTESLEREGRLEPVGDKTGQFLLNHYRLLAKTRVESHSYIACTLGGPWVRHDLDQGNQVRCIERVSDYDALWVLLAAAYELILK
jgi:hypothetical protein